MQLLKFLCVLLWQAQYCFGAAVVDEIDGVRYGSTAGGTKLRVVGSGFKSSFNIGGRDDTGSHLFLVNDIYTIPCQLERVHTSSTVITCFTGEAPASSYSIRIVTDGVLEEQTCPTCLFTTRSGDTPTLTQLYLNGDTNTFGGYIDSMATGRGKIYTQVFGPNDMTSLGENNENSFRRVYFGEGECSLVKPDNPDEKYGITLDSEGSKFGEVNCKIEERNDFVGYVNVSYINTLKGRSKPSDGLFHVSPRDKVYMIQKYDVVSTSPQSGSTEGGTIITVDGTSFDTAEKPHKTRIVVGREPCEVVPGSLTHTRVKCHAPPKPDTVYDYYAGSRGVLIEWSNDSISLNDIRTNLNNESLGYTAFYHDSAGYEWPNAPPTDTNFCAKMTGIFRTAVDDRYQFYLKCDDQCKLYITCSGSFSNLTEIASVPYYTTRYTRFQSQRTNWMELKKGDLCYFEASLLNTGGPGSMHIAALRATTSLTDLQSPRVYQEKQYLRWTAPSVDDVQEITFNDWNTTDPSSAVNERLTIQVVSDCHAASACSGVFYSLDFNGELSMPISAVATAAEMKSAIDGLLTLPGDDVVVTRSDVANGHLYVITFSNNMGDYPDFSHSITPGQAYSLTITITETIKGIPDFTKFALSYKGRSSNPIPVEATADEVKDEIEKLFGAKCPDSFLPEPSALTLVAMDYEGARTNSGERGTRISNFPAFCGRKSLLNPDHLYYDTWSDFRIFEARDQMLCFAHYGEFKQHIKFKYSFEDENNNDKKYIWWRYVAMDPNIPMGQNWDYHCFDLESMLINNIGGSYSPAKIKIYYIGVNKLSNKPIHDFYIDAVYIGKNPPNNVPADISRRIPAVRHDGKFLDEIDVNKVGNEPKYSVTIKFHDCPQHLELLQVTNADTKTSDEIDLLVVRNSNWPSDIAVMTTRISNATQGMSGTFDISHYSEEHGTQRLNNIPATIGKDKLEAKLETLPGFEHVEVTDVGSCKARRFYVEWLNTGGDREPIQVNLDNIVGSPDLSYELVILIEGGAMHAPIGGDMVARVYDKPQVEVFINEMPSFCNSTCEFSWMADETPKLTSVSPISGVPGTSVIFVGTLLDDISAASNETLIKIGGEECTVTAQSATSLACDVGNIGKGTHDIIVNIGGRGMAKHPAVALKFEQTEITIASINPATGYTSGGMIVEITGTGFPEDEVINIGSQPCETISIEFGLIKCIVPPSTTEAAVNVATTVNIDAAANLANGFTYSNTGQAVIVSIDPLIIYGSGGDTVEINVDQFTNDSSVIIDGKHCKVHNYTDPVVFCTAPRLSAGTYVVDVLIDGKGYADKVANSIGDMEYKFVVTALDPIIGSFAGGQEFTLTGEGFNNATKVSFSGHPCIATFVDNTQLVCEMKSYEKHYMITNDGVHPSFGKGYGWKPAILRVSRGDTVTWKWSLDEKRTGSYGIRVFMCDLDNPYEPNDSNIMSLDSDGDGMPDKTKIGSFVHKFTKTGAFHFSSGRVDDEDWGSILMKGTVFVNEPPVIAINVLKVEEKGIEAIYNPGGKKRKKRTACTELTAPITGCKDSHLTTAQKTMFVDDHNAVRSNVSPTAANMLKVEWNDNIESNVIPYAKQCNFAHSSNADRSNVGGFSVLGENIYLTSQRNNIDGAITASTQAWASEVSEYTFSNNSCAPGRACGHYTQVVWHDSYAIGCAVVDCNSPIINFGNPGTLVICQYGKAGNYIGVKPYTSGASCSACPLDYTCGSGNNLCEETPSSLQIMSDFYRVGLSIAMSSDSTFSVSVSKCYTAYMTSISPNSGTINDTIVIKGNGFGDDTCVNTVTIGESENAYNCIVLASNETEIKCKPDPTSSSPIAVQLAVSVTVLGRGVALDQIPANEAKTFTLLPSITRIDVQNGSFAGGTIVNITGVGFEGSISDEIVNVYVHIVEAEITSLTYTEIIINTPPSSATMGSPLSIVTGDLEVKLLKNSATIPAACLSDCTFTYDKTYTPVIDTIAPTTLNSDNQNLVIRGSRFNDATVQVTLGGQPCSIQSNNGTMIECTTGEVMAGQRTLIVYVPNLGYAHFINPSMEQVTGDGTVTMSPTTGGTFGGTIIMLIGLGFNASDLEVTVNAVVCDIISFNNTHIYFITPPLVARSTTMVSVTITANDHSYGGVPSFTFDPAENPVITSITPTSGDPGDTVTLAGTGLTPTSDLVTISVKVGNTDCAVQAGNTATSITCILGSPITGGTFDVEVLIPGSGFATTTGVEFQYSSTATGVSPSAGSIGGGNLLTINGAGFGNDTLIYVCDYKCNLMGGNDSLIDGTSVTYTSVTCLLEKAPTYSTRVARVVVETGGIFNQRKLSSLRPNPSIDDYQRLGFTIDNCYQDCDLSSVLTPVVRDDSGNTLCSSKDYTNIFSGTFAHGEQFTAWRPIPCSEDFICLGDIILEGTDKPMDDLFIKCVHKSLASESTISVAPIYQPSSGEFSIWGINGSDWFVASDSNTNAPAINVYKLLDMTSASDEKICNVTVILSDAAATTTIMQDAYQMQNALTPTVTDVSPRRGGTGGGTNITITGTGFSSTMSENSVKIDGTTCDVTAVTATEIKCTTNTNSRTIRSTVVVTVTGKGRSLDQGAEYYYVDVWSSIWTWGGGPVPTKGDFVVVQRGQTLLLDASTEILEIFLINGGLVIFDDKDIELQAINILIMNGGVMKIGEDSAPFQNRATITLFGHLRSKEMPIYGTKTIAVRDGQLFLHGKPVNPVWTRLRETANAGDTVLKLDEAVDWEMGAKIVIASTGDRLSQRENEKRTIKAVTNAGTDVEITEALTYSHIANTQTFTGGIELTTAAEVGILTRNIVVRGSRNMEWNDTIEACPDGFNPGEFATQTCFQGRFGEEIGSDEFGGQVMLHNSIMDSMKTRGVLEFVEFYYMGQAFRLGRYAIHFHLLGDIKFTSHVKGCAIHETFNRATTIHGTHQLLVENNILYNVMGGAIFIEDGIETGCKILKNLIVFCKQSTSLLTEDITPAAVWVTNPDNIVEDNVAAGGTHFGFWYRMRNHPEGASHDESICPKKIELSSFKRNSAHSQGWFGLWIFQDYFPKRGGCCGCGNNEPAIFQDMFVWNCEKGAEAVNVGAIKFDSCLMANNELTGIEFKMLKGVHWGDAGVSNSVFIGHSDISGADEQSVNAIVVPFFDGIIVENATFINFDRKGAVINTAKVQGTCADFCGGWNAILRGITFINSPRKVAFKWQHEQVLIDEDGTFTEEGTRKLVLPSMDIVPAPSKCQDSADMSHGAVPGMMCDGDMKFHRLAWNKVHPSSLEGRLVNISNQYGSVIAQFARKRLTHKPGYMALLLSGERYEWVYDNADFLTNISYDAGFYDFKDNDCVIMTHQLSQTPDKFVFVRGQDKNSTSTMLDCSSNFNGDYYFDEDTKYMEFIVNARDPTSRRKRGFSSHTADPDAVNREINAEVIRCFFEGCVPPPDPNNEPPVDKRPRDFKYWSQHYIARSAAPLDYKIERGEWIVVDVALPTFGELVLEGVMELEVNMSHVINATNIIIWGGRLIAGFKEELPFNGNVHIILNGNHETTVTEFAPAMNLGAKLIGVFGGLDLHGIAKNVTKTKLATTANAGDAAITVVQDVDWEIDDIVMITTTSYNPWETEVFKITSVEADRRTINLNSTLAFMHRATEVSHTTASGSISYTIAADVALMSRSITIEGAEYDELFVESFGGRVIIGGFSDDNSIRGYARISNVAFYRMGQEGWNEIYDNHGAIAYSGSGESNNIKPSYVRKSSFLWNFNTAISVYGADKIEITDNAVYHTVGPSLWVVDDDHIVSRNLVALMVNPGTYQGRDNSIWTWFAAVQVNEAGGLTMNDNVVAGSEKAGYWINGQACDTPSSDLFMNNEARAILDGVYMNKDGVRICTKVHGFIIHKAFDYGIYYQSAHNLIIDNVVITDSGCGIITLFNGPSSLGHVYVEKYAHIQNVVINAQVESIDCDTLALSLNYMQVTTQGRSPTNRRFANGGHAGIFWPSFMGGHNNAPEKPLHGLMSYPALGGGERCDNCTFVNFVSNVCNGKAHTVYMTNAKNEDYLHPVRTRNVHFVNTSHANKVFIARPSIGKINPSDCVDMECDAFKNAIIIDEDGSFIGGSAGTIIPQAEYQWDGEELSRGLGDYRIPKTFLTYTNGSRIPVEDVAPYKGILRANTSTTTCVIEPDWQAHSCQGYKHQLFIIESIDADTETRRLSPVALISEKYIDLENGPQDHGWCAGYTCQKRISTFYTTVAANHVYQLFFTGTAPQHLRLRMPHIEDGDSIVIKIFYTTAYRLDVYFDGNYILPKDGEYQNGNVVLKKPTTPGEFEPTLADPTGLNYFDGDKSMLHIVVKGKNPVDIKVKEVIILKFGFPAITSEEFFDEDKIVGNLAAFFDIPPERIRVMNVVREGSTRRRKKRSGGITADVEISPPTTNSSSALNSTDSFDETQTTLGQLLDFLQTGGDLGSVLNETVEVEIEPVILPPNHPGYEDQITALDNGETLQTVIVRVSNLQMMREPSLLTPFDQPFEIQPKFWIMDENGDRVKVLGVPVNPWLIEATGENGTVLTGNTTAPFVDGYATFANLGISSIGYNKRIIFKMIFPTNLNGSDWTLKSRQLRISPSLSTPDECFPLEGEHYDIRYNYTSNCARVCLNTCQENFEVLCTDLNQCGPHASCVSDVCECKKESQFSSIAFDENNITETLNAKVMCKPNSIELVLDKCAMNALGFWLYQMFIWGDGGVPLPTVPPTEMDDVIRTCENSCRGKVTADEHGIAYGFEITKNLSHCNALILENATHISYAYAVHGKAGFANDFITTIRPIEIKFSCVYARMLQSGLGYKIQPFIRTVEADVHGAGTYNISFQMYEDASYNTLMTAQPHVRIARFVYLSISVEGVEDAKMLARECWATGDSVMYDSTRHNIIDDSCPTQNENVEVTQNGVSNEVRFAFRAFAFNAHVDGSPQLYVHCKVSVCEGEDVHDCDPECTQTGTRHKRESPKRPTKEIVIGPIILETEEVHEEHRVVKRDTYATDSSFEDTLNHGVGMVDYVRFLQAYYIEI